MPQLQLCVPFSVPLSALGSSLQFVAPTRLPATLPLPALCCSHQAACNFAPAHAIAATAVFHDRACAGSAPDWSGDAATNGYPGANFVGLSIGPAKPTPKPKPPARPTVGSAGSATRAGINSAAPASPASAARISSEAPAEQPPLQKPPQGALYIGFNAHSSLLGIHIPDPPAGGSLAG